MPTHEPNPDIALLPPLGESAKRRLPPTRTQLFSALLCRSWLVWGRLSHPTYHASCDPVQSSALSYGRPQPVTLFLLPQLCFPTSVSHPSTSASDFRHPYRRRPQTTTTDHEHSSERARTRATVSSRSNQQRSLSGRNHGGGRAGPARETPLQMTTPLQQQLR